MLSGVRLLFLICVWLHWVLEAACGLCLVVVSGAYSSVTCGLFLDWTRVPCIGRRTPHGTTTEVRVQLLATLWAAAHWDPLSMEFSMQEFWSGLPFLPPGDLLNPGIIPMSPALAGRFFFFFFNHWANWETPQKGIRNTSDIMTPSKIIQFTSLMGNNYHASNFLAPLLLFMCPRKRKHGDLDYFCNTNA